MGSGSDSPPVMRHPGFFLGVTVSVLVIMYAVIIPALSFFCAELNARLRLSAPPAGAFVIATSNWLPLVCAIVGTIALLEKERRVSAGTAWVLNLATLLLVLISGGFAVLVCLLPLCLAIPFFFG